MAPLPRKARAAVVLQAELERFAMDRIETIPQAPPPLPDPPALALGDLDLAALQAAVMAEAQDAVLGALAGGAVRRTRRRVDSPVALMPEQSRVMDPIIDGPYV